METQMYALKSGPFFRCPGNRTSFDAKDAVRFAPKELAQAIADRLNARRSPLNQFLVVPVKEFK